MKTTIYTKTTILIISYLFLGFTNGDKTKLFETKNKSEWHTFLEKSGKDNDPNHVFSFEKDVLHVSGEEFGYICTNKKFTNFKLTLEFKWGEKKFPPREKDARDAGVIYHIQFKNGDKVWPRGVEFQIQEHDCGDFWLVDSVTVEYNHKRTPLENFYRIVKLADAEKNNGEWNKVEIVSNNGNYTHYLNGQKVNEAFNGDLKSGFILLQSEGAEIFYRNIEIETLP